MFPRRVLPITSAMFFLLVLAGGSTSAQADLNCDDFSNQAEAQSSLNGTYPDDPNGLDRDKDWIACEEFFGLSAEEEARVVPADRASLAAQSTPEPTPAPAAPQVDDAEPAPASLPPTMGSRIEPPADLMAEVASCEVVAVSSRSIAAAGCPGIGTILLRPPVGSPRMRSQVIIRPGASFGASNEGVVSAAQVARPDGRARNRDRPERERPRQKRHKAEQAAKQEK